MGIPQISKEEQDRKAMTVKDLLACYLEKYNTPSIKDLKRYREGARCAVNRILARPMAQKIVAELRPVDIVGLRDSLQEAGYLGDAINQTIGRLSVAINWGMDMDIIPAMRSPASSIERMPVIPLEERYSFDDLHRLLRHAEGELLALIAFSLYTGCRPGEARGLRWPDVHLDAPIPYVEIRYSYDTTPKTAGSRRLVPVHPELLPYLRQWQKECPATPEALCFPVPWAGGYRMATPRDGYGLPDLLRDLECHIPSERKSGVLAVQRKRVWHTFRHTFISAMTEAGASGDSISRIVGHGGRGSGAASMTLNYSHVSLEYLRRELIKVSFTPPPLAGVVSFQEAQRQRTADNLDH